MKDFLARVVSIAKAKAPEVLSSAVTTAFEEERNPEVRFTAADKQRGRNLVRAVCKAAEQGDWVQLGKPAGRSALIWAARSVSGDDDVEWAVVGLGTSSEMGRSFIRSVYAKRGRPGSVSLPTSLLAEIRGHLDAEEGAEFVHIHNHPMNVGRIIKNFVVGEDPMASWGDRRFHLEYELFRQDVNRNAIRPRQVRCFVIENGDVRRYRIAAAPELVESKLRDWHRRGWLKMDVDEAIRALGELGFRADRTLVEKLLRHR